MQDMEARREIRMAGSRPSSQAAIGKYASLHGNQAAFYHCQMSFQLQYPVTLTQQRHRTCEVRGRGTGQVHAKIKYEKFIAIYTKTCTYQNFPLCVNF